MANRTGELGKGWRPVYWFKLGTGDLISPQGLPTVQHPLPADPAPPGVSFSAQ